LSVLLAHLPRFSDKEFRTIECRSDVHFAVTVSLLWMLAYNGVFWTQTIQAMWHPALHSALFLASLLVFTVTLQSVLLLLVPQSWMRPVASVLFIVAAISAYFCSSYGAVMNQDMLRNALQTDSAEVSALVTPKLLAYLIVLGLVPATLMWRVVIAPAPRSVRLKRRGYYALCALALSAVGLFSTSADYAVFFREHKPIRYMLMPAAPVTSFIGLITHREHASGPLLNPAGRSERVAASTGKPKVMLLVIGETARAANFSLGGYTRPTNTRLQQVQDLVYFDHATSCGTATAISLPCMFSPFPRTAFKVDDANSYTNLLDALIDAGIQVEWRDNDSGCKGVCSRVQTITYSDRADGRHCSGGHCFDTVMLEDLPERLRSITQDTVIVLHQIGSHGPAYSQRYAADAAAFRPACSSNELQNCSQQEIVNAYDNTIAATDVFLAKAIELLQKDSDRLDSAMLYVSDHGESLGEQGLYLHGMPYAFAPRVQTEVPFMIWTSAAFRHDQGLDNDCLRDHRNDAISHDNLYHTVLGAMSTRNAAYDASLDVMASCRSNGNAGALAESAQPDLKKKQS
jgi:lipid A ethanolaminephosphotransferase